MERIMRESGSDGILLVRRDATGRYATLNVQNDRYLGLGPEGGIGVVYTGVALFKKNVLEKIKQTNFFYILNQNNFDIRILYYQGIWLDLGDPRSYYDSNSQFRKHIHTNGDKVNSLSPRVTISPDSRVENSIVWENTVIRGASRISNSIMTGNMVLDSVRYANKIITGGGVFDL
jgi:NDP-sugar pyrophosphorylase family protein